jgi:methyl-accepting chemotaxis protein
MIQRPGASLAETPVARSGGGPIRNLKVRSKILLAISIMGLLAVGVGALGLARANSLNQALTQMRRNNVEHMRMLADLNGAISLENIATVGYLYAQPAKDKAGMDTAITQWDDGDKAAELALEEYLATSKGSPARVTAGVQAQKSQTQIVAVRKLYLQGTPLPAGITYDKSDPAAYSNLTEARDQAVAAIRNIEIADAAAAAAAGESTYQKTIWLISGILVAGMVIAMLVAIRLAGLITKPLTRVSAAMKQIAQGDLTQSVPIESRDEVGQMATDVNAASGSVRTAISSLAAGAVTLSSSAKHIVQVSGRIVTSAAGTSAQAQAVAAAADIVSQNVQTVSAGSDEMSTSIREIARSASDGAKVASKAVDVVRSTNNTVSKLGDSSAEIGTVIKTITSIAEQTNLLALNATIEAARAGELGKGFAVVAGEVKDLAQETAKATEDISRRVEAIQGDTRSAVQAIAEISDIIGQINDFQTVIAAAVEEQSATTAEMNRNVVAAANGSGEIATNITGMAGAAAQTAQGVDEAQQAAGGLVDLSAEFDRLVAQFRY